MNFYGNWQLAMDLQQLAVRQWVYTSFVENDYHTLCEHWTLCLHFM